MPHRAEPLLLGILGLVTVAALLLLGMDVYLAARKGSRWKRRLVGAGLGLMGLLGLLSWAPPVHGEEKVQEARNPRVPVMPEKLRLLLTGDETPLTSYKQWDEIRESWHESREVRLGKKGVFPFTREEKARLIARLEKASEHVSFLEKLELLTAEEGAYLRMEFPFQIRRVKGWPTKDLEKTSDGPTPVPFPYAPNLGYLSERLKHLEKLVEAEGFHRPVLKRVIREVDRHAGLILDGSGIVGIPPGQRDEAMSTAKKARELANKLEVKIGGALAWKRSLAKDSRWIGFTAGWREGRETLKKRQEDRCPPRHGEGPCGGWDDLGTGRGLAFGGSEGTLQKRERNDRERRAPPLLLFTHAPSRRQTQPDPLGPGFTPGPAGPDREDGVPGKAAARGGGEGDRPDRETTRPSPRRGGFEAPRG
ncbi:MAG: hypothetical protein ACYTFG_03050 [Planctomycetota bacterium]